MSTPSLPSIDPALAAVLNGLLDQRLGGMQQEHAQREQALQQQIAQLTELLAQARVQPTTVPVTPPSASASPGRAALTSPGMSISPSPTPSTPETPSSTQSGASSTRSRSKRSATPSTTYQLRQADRPEDTSKLAKAFFLHLRILANLLDHNQTLPVPSAQALAAFHSRFGDDAALRAARGGPCLVSQTLLHIAHLHQSARPGTTLAYAAMVEEHILEYMQEICARYGLIVFCPNLQDTPFSRYNSAHRIIAIDTFKQASAAHAYSFLGPNLQHVSNTTLLIRLFDHFFFHVELARFKREQAQPGSLVSTAAQHTVIVNRARLAAARHAFARRQGFPNRYLRILKNPRTASDDELDPDTGKWIIKHKHERSPEAERLVRGIDALRHREARLKGRPLRERQRVLPATPIPSQMIALPFEVPVDYFTPAFFNSLSRQLRTKIIGKDKLPSVAFPPSLEWILATPQHASERMTDGEFMALYGDYQLQDYDIGYESEYDGEGEADDDDDGWMDDEDGVVDDDDEEAMASNGSGSMDLDREAAQAAQAAVGMLDSAANGDTFEML